MKHSTQTQLRREFVSGVRAVVADRISSLELPGDGERLTAFLQSGKMLRTRLAARLVVGGDLPVNREAVARACAATEIAHTATLCHDDVIDNAAMRRSCPTAWKTVGSPSAVLLGDMLLCDAFRLILETEGGRYADLFLSKVGEVCAAEAEHETRLLGQQLDVETCLRLARGKTGPLFAFAAHVCGGSERPLCSALEEAGYRIGTAYQLADDLLDLIGNEEVAGKTLGTDMERGKFTLPQAADGKRLVSDHVRRLCRSAASGLEGWPEVQRALEMFIVQELQALLERSGILLALDEDSLNEA